jgi:hypothetical protein
MGPSGIRMLGFSNPILVGEGGDVIAGHGRLGVINCDVHREYPTTKHICWVRLSAFVVP